MDNHQLDWIDAIPARAAPPSAPCPTKPGHRGVDTSIAAAETLAPRLPSIQRQVIAVIKAAGATGATGDEVAAVLGWERFAVRPRTAELRKAGAICDSGQRRANASGRTAIVWIVN